MPSFWTSLVGSKPNVPNLPSLNLGTEQQKAIAANLTALPASESLVSKANLFSQQQITDMLNKIIPGYSSTAATISGNIASEAQGKIPTDVQQQIESSDAAKALSGGYGGTGAANSLTARDLGLTSLNLTNQALSSMESWTKTAASLYEPSMLNLSSMFITPGQEAQFDVNERNTQFQREWLQNQINAMPAPWAEDLKQFVYRAMAAYSGTSVGNNPYSTPGSFGGGGVGGEPGAATPNFAPDTGGGASPYSAGAGEGGAAFDASAGGGGGFFANI